MRTGIVLVAFNQVEFTLDCLRSLAAVPEASLIVLVDNASQDGTTASVRQQFPDVTVLPQSENRGFTGGNNVGIRWCLEQGCDTVLLLNNDTTVEPDFLARLLPHSRSGDIAVPEIRPGNNTLGPQDDLSWFDWRRGIAQPIHKQPPSVNGLPTRIASGCCLLIPRQVFDQIGLLDERFFLYFEDVDFVVRAQLAGFRISYEPKSVVYHYGGASGGYPKLSPKTLYYNTRNRIFLMSKYRRITPEFVFYFAATRLVYAVLYGLTGRIALLMSIVRAVRDSMTGRLAAASYWK